MERAYVMMAPLRQRHDEAASRTAANGGSGLEGHGCERDTGARTGSFGRITSLSSECGFTA
eukprot:scaffold11709_cov145-Isochrysis_galbana.AAC.5